MTMREQRATIDEMPGRPAVTAGDTGRAGRVGLALVGAVAAWLTVSQWAIYPFTILGQDNALRACGLAVVLGMTALLGWNAAHPLLPGLVCAAGGVLLLGVAFLVPHVADRSVISESVSGAVTLLAAALVLRDA